jgi:hypothetical protein
MIRKIPIIKYLCPFCGKVISGYTKIQVYFNYSIHLAGGKCVWPPKSGKEREEKLKRCRVTLGITEDEIKSVKTPRKQIIRCPKCNYEWKGKNPFRRKSKYIKCPKCKSPISTFEVQNALLEGEGKRNWANSTD